MTTCIDISSVTQEQIDRCHRIIGPDGKAFYQVESESDSMVEYEVRFTPGRGFTCTCPAGQEGFHHCSKGTCKHCRWAYAAAQVYRQEQAEQAQIERYVSRGVDRETASRVVYAQPTQYSELEVERAECCNERKPFSILR